MAESVTTIQRLRRYVRRVNQGPGSPGWITWPGVQGGGSLITDAQVVQGGALGNIGFLYTLKAASCRASTNTEATFKTGTIFFDDGANLYTVRNQVVILPTSSPSLGEVRISPLPVASAAGITLELYDSAAFDGAVSVEVELQMVRIP